MQFFLYNYYYYPQQVGRRIDRSEAPVDTITTRYVRSLFTRRALSQRRHRHREESRSFAAVQHYGCRRVNLQTRYYVNTHASYDESQTELCVVCAGLTIGSSAISALMRYKLTTESQLFNTWVLDGESGVVNITGSFSGM